jgi:hypothetical protein
LYRDCLDKGDKLRTMHNIQEGTIVEDVSINIPIISAALEIRWADHQSNMIEIEGKIANQSISILIDSRASHSYIAPNLVERFHLKRSKHDKSWIVQLSTETKRKINEIAKGCPIDMNNVNTIADTSIIPLGSYDVLIGMD